MSLHIYSPSSNQRTILTSAFENGEILFWDLIETSHPFMTLKLQNEPSKSNLFYIFRKKYYQLDLIKRVQLVFQVVQEQILLFSKQILKRIVVGLKKYLK